MSASAAARALGLSLTRTLSLIHSGRLPAERVGNILMVKACDIEAFARRPRRPGRPRKEGAPDAR